MTRARLATAIGLGAYYRAKGAIWLDTVQPIVMLALGGGAALKYLTGLPTRWVIGIMVTLAVGREVGAVLLGWLEHRSGATEAHYQAAAQTDPYRRESLALLREIRDRLDVRGKFRRSGDR